MKKFLKWTFLLLFIGAAGFLGWLYFSGIAQHDPYGFIPQDAIYIVESSEPIENWKDFSNTSIWKHLKKNKVFADIESNCDYLDSLIHDNEQIMDLIGERPVLVSAHMKGNTDYDFLYVVDLKKGAKITFFKDILLEALGATSWDVDKEAYKGEEILTLTDSEEPEDPLFLGFKDNILLCSYTKQFIGNAFDQAEHPYFDSLTTFRDIHQHTGEDGLCRMYLNYDALKPYLGLYMEDPSSGTDLAQLFRFTGMAVKATDENITMEGYSSVVKDAPTLVNGLLTVDAEDRVCESILPSNTSFYMNFSFENFHAWISGIEQYMQQDSGAWADYQKQRKFIEKFLKISLDEDFLNHIGNSITLGLLPLDEEGYQSSYFAAFHLGNVDGATAGLEHIAEQIRKRTPVKFEDQPYQEYTIKSLEMKGFFRAFLGKLFDRFDKPKFVILRDYVIFSNETTTLEKFIDAASNKDRLGGPKYDAFMKLFPDDASITLYARMDGLYHTMIGLGDAETKQSLFNNKKYITCFPQVAMTFKEDDGRFRTRLSASFEAN